MSDEPTRGRSPNCPKITLEEALSLAGKLYKESGKAKIKGETAATTFGYASLNGSALTMIGALNQYGLLDKDEKGNISISSDAIALLHPTSDDQRLELLRKCVQKPKVFSDLLAGGFQQCSENVLSSHLIQSGFATDAAKKVASVFKENLELAKLTDSGINSDETLKTEAQSKPTKPENPPQASPRFAPLAYSGVGPGNINPPSPPFTATLSASESVLASYSVPLGENEVSIVFRGKKLLAEDFDALGEYVQLFKKQYERKIKAIESDNLDSNLPGFLRKTS